MNAIRFYLLADGALGRQHARRNLRLALDGIDRKDATTADDR